MWREQARCVKAGFFFCFVASSKLVNIAHHTSSTLLDELIGRISNRMSRFLRCSKSYKSLHRSIFGKNPSFVRAQNGFLSQSDIGESKRTSKRNFAQIHSGDNPFEVLGIPKSATYSEAKQRFLQLALKHHPDHAATKEGDEPSEQAKSKMADDFIRLRKAFESLKETMDGDIAQVEEGESSWTDEEFNAWYYEETGHSDLMFRMDMKTRREVIDVVKNAQAQGGLDRGGIWEMARRMAEEEEILKENKNKIKRTVGLNDGGKSPANSGLQRRRRKKR